MFCANGQTSRDSLLSIWNDKTIADTTRLRALYNACSNDFIYQEPDSVFFLAKEAYAMAERKNLPKESSIALLKMGIANKNTTNYNEATRLFRLSLDISERINDDEGYIKSKNLIGNVYLAKSDYAKAASYYIEALKKAEKIQDLASIATLSNNIGLVYFDLLDYERALDYLNKSLDVKTKIGKPETSATTLINIGTIYRNKKDYKNALYYYERGLEGLKKLNQKNGLAVCYSNLGVVYLALNQTEKALDYFDQSMKIHRSADNKKGIANCLIHFGRVYQTSNPDTTITLASQALSIAKKTENTAEIRDAAQLLHRAYETQGKYKQALAMYKLYRETDDKILSIESQKAVLTNEYKYREEKRLLEEEVKLHTLELKAQRNRYILIGSILLIFFALGYYIKRRYDQILEKRKDLLHKIEILKEKLATQTISSTQKRKELSLDKEKIEKAIDNKIGESSWMILSLIFENPSLSNKEIAEKVSLSVEGVSSSLRRMYAAFDIKSSGNKKITLLMKAVNISVQD